MPRIGGRVVKELVREPTLGAKAHLKGTDYLPIFWTARWALLKMAPCKGT